MSSPRGTRVLGFPRHRERGRLRDRQVQAQVELCCRSHEPLRTPSGLPRERQVRVNVPPPAELSLLQGSRQKLRRPQLWDPEEEEFTPSGCLDGACSAELSSCTSDARRTPSQLEASDDGVWRCHLPCGLWSSHSLFSRGHSCTCYLAGDELPFPPARKLRGE